MNSKAIALAIIALGAAPIAIAQVTVLGSGLGKDCYTAVKYSKTGIDNAERICTKALQSGSLTHVNRKATFINRGIARMRGGQYDGALKDYAAAERISTEDGTLYLNRGAAYIYKKDFAAALEDLNKSIELETQDLFAAHYNRAIAKENTGDVNGAYFDFKKALELKPDFTQAQQQLERFTVVSN